MNERKFSLTGYKIRYIINEEVKTKGKKKKDVYHRFLLFMNGQG